MGHDLTAREAADRLGVELATIYAYASRGALTRRSAGDGRRSAYDADEVEALARRARPRSARRRIAAVDVVIGTTISEIGDGWIRYRGIDVLELAGHRSFETVCGLLWTGALTLDPWASNAGRSAEVALAAAQASRTLPDDAPVRTRLALGAAVASAHLSRPLAPGAGAPGADDRSTASLPTRAHPTGPPGPIPPDDPTRAGPVVIDALVASLPIVGEGRSPDRPSLAEEAHDPVSRRLWRRISPLPCTPARQRALDVALVLLAEHELATSTLAARVAASTRAGAAEIVAAGLAAVSGPLHGRAAVRVHEHLRSPRPTPLDAPTATMGDGLGHVVHRRGDPRFAPLLAQATAIATPAQRRRIDAALAVDVAGPRPNVDAALASLALAATSEVGMTEAVFAIARTAGWLAHGWEELDEPPLRYRGRTLYRGPRLDATT